MLPLIVEFLFYQFRTADILAGLFRNADEDVGGTTHF